MISKDQHIDEISIEISERPSMSNLLSHLTKCAKSNGAYLQALDERMTRLEQRSGLQTEESHMNDCEQLFDDIIEDVEELIAYADQVLVGVERLRELKNKSHKKCDGHCCKKEE